MIEYRITKFNPQNRRNNKYIAHEWTSVSDIGKAFDSGVLTADQYNRIETAYIDCSIELLRKADIDRLLVCSPEYYDKDIRFPEILYVERDIRWAIKCCLQEKSWVKLEANNFFIHFGYDYYMYIGTELPSLSVEKIVNKHHLFCEKTFSPYRS